MHRRKHKRKMNHVVLVTSDATGAGLKQFKIRPGFVRVVTLVICVGIGVGIGYGPYVIRRWDETQSQNTEQSAAVQVLEDENESLRAQIIALNDQIQILSATVNEKIQSENELAEKLEQQSIPSGYPLTRGTTSMEEAAEGDPMIIFTAAEGNTVVATARGTVMSVNSDAEYGHNVWIDHGNGYITIYRNQGEPIVKQGETVVQGTTLFVVGEDNDKLGYQMMRDSEYINPMDMMAISG